MGKTGRPGKTMTPLDIRAPYVQTTHLLYVLHTVCIYIYIINTYTYIHIHIIYIYTLYMGINLKVQGRNNYCDDRSYHTVLNQLNRLCLVVMVVGVFF
jgi:hypothetical protein